VTMGHTTDGAVMGNMTGNRRHSNTIARWYRWMRLDNGSARSDGRKPLLAQPMLDYLVLLVVTLLLLGIGTLMSLSSSSVYAQMLGNSPYYFAKRQLGFLAIGIIAGLVFGRFSEEFLRRTAGIVWVVVGLMLVATLFMGDDAGKGNRSWLSVGPVGVQPSEFAKFSLVLIGAAYLARHRETIGEVKDFFWFLAIQGSVILMVLVQGDLGTALILAAIVLVQMWVCGMPVRHILTLLAVGAVGVVAMIVQAPYRMQRIITFLDPSSDSTTSDQPLAATYALATGGLGGVGIGASKQKWGGLYDGAQNDFVFAVLGEELGLVGTVTVIVLFALLCWAGIRVAVRSQSQFLRIAAATITTWIGVQALINMAVSLTLAPVIGVPLPFISVGGSALVSNLAAMGVLLSCARREPAAQRYLDATRRRKPPRVTSVVDDSGSN